MCCCGDVINHLPPTKVYPSPTHDFKHPRISSVFFLKRRCWAATGCTSLNAARSAKVTRRHSDVLWILLLTVGCCEGIRAFLGSSHQKSHALLADFS
eukprot:s736_g5.t1